VSVVLEWCLCGVRVVFRSLCSCTVYTQTGRESDGGGSGEEDEEIASTGALGNSDTILILRYQHFNVMLRSGNSDTILMIL
jgi:hypothetical protein